MMKYKKGFTLIELLSVIILIGLLIGIGVPGISKISSNMKNKSLNTKIKLIEQAGILYGQDNKAMLQSTKCFIDDESNDVVNCKKISIRALINNDYLDSENFSDVVYTNPKNGINLASTSMDCNENRKDNIVLDSDSCCVHIYKKNNRVYSYFGKNSCEKGFDIIAFKVDGGETGQLIFIAEKDMTWYEFIKSDYNIDNTFKILSDSTIGILRTSDNQYMYLENSTSNQVKSTEKLIPDYTYQNTNLPVVN